MDRVPSPESVEPNPGLPKTIGVLNVVFGVLLLLCGGGCLRALAPGMSKHPALQLEREVTQETANEMRRQLAVELRQKEDRAAGEAEKARLRTEREKRFEGTPPRIESKVDFAKVNLGMRRFSIYLWVEIISGPIFNFLMLIAGIGLVGLKGWGRKLGVWAALLKILRLVGLGVFLCFFVFPSLYRGFDEFTETDIVEVAVTKYREDQREKQGGVAPVAQPMLQDPREFMQAMKAMGYGWAVLYTCFGVIYPVIALVVLTRPAARAACARTRESGPESVEDFSVTGVRIRSRSRSPMAEPSVVIPNPRIPSALGFLNVAFGLMLLLASLGMVGWMLAYPSLVQMMMTPERQKQAREQAELETQIERLKIALATETDPEKRTPLLVKLTALEDELDTKYGSNGFDPNQEAMKDSRIAVPFWLDHLLGMILNGLMIAAGSGLIALRAWGRRLALQVAGLKLAKLIIMTSLAVGFTIPLNVARTKQLYDKFEARTGAASAMPGAGVGAQLAAITAITSTATTVGYGVLGIIYPALCLWLLNKKSVRAACTPIVPGGSKHPSPQGQVDLA